MTRVILARRPAPTLTDFGTFATSLSSGTFSQYTPSDPFTQSETNWDAQGVTAYNTKGWYDALNRAFNFQGGPHSTKVPRHLRFSEDTDSCAVVSSAAPYSDGVTTVHGYQHYTGDPATGDSYHCPIGGGNYNGSNVFRLTNANRDTGNWSQINGGHGGSSTFSHAVEWFPERARLIWVDANSIREYDPVGNSWSTLDASPAGMDFGSWACYSPAEQAVYYGGGSAQNAMYRLASDGSVTSRTDTPINVSTEYEGTIAPDWSGTGTLICYGNASGTNGNHYRYTQSSNSWSASLGTHGMYVSPLFEAICVPCEAYGVNVFLRENASSSPEIWVHRP